VRQHPEGEPRPEGEPLDPVDVRDIADRGETEAGAREGGEPTLGDAVDFLTNLFEVLPLDRTGHSADRLRQRLGPAPPRIDRLLEPADGRPRDDFGRNGDVQIIVIDLPAATDDGTGGKIEPGHPASDLHFLAPGQPPALFHPGVVDNDADVLHRGVEVGSRREAEAEADQVSGGTIEGEGTHDAWSVEIAGADLDLVQLEHGIPDPQAHGVPEPEVVQGKPLRGEGVDDVLHFVSLADPDPIAEVVGDNTEVVAVVGDVGG